MGLFGSKKIYAVKYLGGHPEIVKESAANLILDSEKVVISIPLRQKAELKYQDITMQHKTYEQISKDITLGRVLLVGIFALAWKKKRVDKKGYITIRYNDEILGEVEIILEHKSPAEVVGNFLNLKRKHLSA